MSKIDELIELRKLNLELVEALTAAKPVICDPGKWTWQERAPIQTQIEDVLRKVGSTSVACLAIIGDML